MKLFLHWCYPISISRANLMFLGIKEDMKDEYTARFLVLDKIYIPESSGDTRLYRGRQDRFPPGLSCYILLKIRTKFIFSRFVFRESLLSWTRGTRFLNRFYTVFFIWNLFGRGILDCLILFPLHQFLIFNFFTLLGLAEIISFIRNHMYTFFNTLSSFIDNFVCLFGWGIANKHVFITPKIKLFETILSII